MGGPVPRVGERFLLCCRGGAGWLGFAAFAWLDTLHGYFLSCCPGPDSGLRNDSLRRAAHQCRHVFGSSDPDRHCFGGKQRTFPARRAGGCIRDGTGADARIRSHPEHPACPFQLAGQAQRQIVANRARLHDIPIPAVFPQGSVPRRPRCSMAHFWPDFALVMLACAFSAWSGGVAVLLLLPKSSPLIRGKPMGMASVYWGEKVGHERQLLASNCLDRQGGSMKSSLALFAVLGLLPMAQAQTTPAHPADSRSDGPAPGPAVHHAAHSYLGSSRASHHLSSPRKPRRDRIHGPANARLTRPWRQPSRRTIRPRFSRPRPPWAK